MNLQTYVLCFLAGLLGLLFYIFAMKIPAVKERARVANMPFTISGYLADDFIPIIASFLSILIWLLVLKEALIWKPVLEGWVIAVSVFVGFGGTNILITLLGQAQKKINDVVDVKTDKADGTK